jgi:hypothetical protein
MFFPRQVKELWLCVIVLSKIIDIIPVCTFAEVGIANFFYSYVNFKQCFGSALTLCGSGSSFENKCGSGFWIPVYVKNKIFVEVKKYGYVKFLMKIVAMNAFIPIKLIFVLFMHNYLSFSCVFFSSFYLFLDLPDPYPHSECGSGSRRPIELSAYPLKVQLNVQGQVCASAYAVYFGSGTLIVKLIFSKCRMLDKLAKLKREPTAAERREVEAWLRTDPQVVKVKN